MIRVYTYTYNTAVHVTFSYALQAASTSSDDVVKNPNVTENEYENPVYSIPAKKESVRRSDKLTTSPIVTL